MLSVSETAQADRLLALRTLRAGAKKAGIEGQTYPQRKHCRQLDHRLRHRSRVHQVWLCGANIQGS